MWPSLPHPLLRTFIIILGLSQFDKRTFVEFISFFNVGLIYCHCKISLTVTTFYEGIYIIFLLSLISFSEFLDQLDFLKQDSTRRTFPSSLHQLHFVAFLNLFIFLAQAQFYLDEYSSFSFPSTVFFHVAFWSLLPFLSKPHPRRICLLFFPSISFV